jgi:phenylacetate-CoA ligase
MVRQLERIGYKIGDRVAVLRGPIVFDKNKIYDFRPKEARLILSTYDLSRQRLREYTQALNDFQIRFLHVYPASLALFIDYVRCSSEIITFPFLKGVLAGSEGLLPNQKELCEKILGVPCYHWYGHSEGTLMGGWCEDTEKFHFFPQYGYLEMVSVSAEGMNTTHDVGELVGTGFCNSAMILIRYRTGDVGSGLRWKKCICGRQFPTLDRIYGRAQDYVVASDGCKIPVTALVFGLHLPIFNHYRKIQVEQLKPGIITIRLENPRGPSHDREIELSKTAMERALNGRISVYFEEVDSIPPRKNGKHQFLIQNLASSLS